MSDADPRGRLAADFLSALAAEDKPFTGLRLHPAISTANRQLVLDFWQQQGVAGMVLRVYSAQSVTLALGQQGYADLVASAIVSQNEAMGLLAVLAQVLALANSAGVSVVPFKGPSESQALYGDFGVRESTDIDLLVSPKQRDAFLATLLSNGWVLRGLYADLGPQARYWYRRMQHALVLTSAAGVSLDLHWRINEYPLLNLDESRWLEDRSLPARICGQPAYQLEPVSRYLALLAHAARSQWSQLKWWADLVRARKLAVTAVGEVNFISQLAQAGADGLDADWCKSWANLSQGLLPASNEPAYWLLSHEEMSPGQHFSQMWRLRSSLRYRAMLCARELIRWEDVRQYPLPDGVFFIYFLLRPPLWLLRRASIIR